MRRRRNPEKQSAKMAFVFAAIVLFFILISLILRMVSLIGKSSFDGVHQFIIEVASYEEKGSKIISFAPDITSVSILYLPKGGRALKIPIDGSITASTAGLSNGKDVSSDLQTFIFGYGSIKTNLTIIDLIRLYLFAKTVPASNFTYKEASLSLFEEEKGDKILSSLFTDYTLSKEAVSIQIVNGTNVSGFGNRLARLISNMGGNVISVSTSEKAIKTSEILYLDSSYTVERLGKVLSIKKRQMEKPMLFDIVIQIGEDFQKSLKF
ncbi:MAG: LytR C-terminal domain-containing protein [bacterium]|nr:LytR C-terminal domain-containing protein [bacterium]